ncbi:protein FAM43A [Ischnura elegans]|uniref:protein FAM43A n=1 Tax=Ischnura elegans TaxID=197161 RepID=UPI001ED866D0|nr:protein FAM43A [Ischnura elegans]
MSSEGDGDSSAENERTTTGGEGTKSGGKCKGSNGAPPQDPPCVKQLNEKRTCVVLPDPPSTSSAKDFRERTLRSIKAGLGKLWKRRSINITDYDPSYKVAYLGNVLTGWAKGEGCLEKPLATLWKNYCSSSKPDVGMKVTVTPSGLKAVTREHGLTEYWSHRVTYCAAPPSHPRLFCWVYRHEGRRLRQELRCHAVLCSRQAHAQRMAEQLRARLAQALSEFRRDKLVRQKARLSLANGVHDDPGLLIPRRRLLLATGARNYRPPLERSKSAPRLTAIEEGLEDEEVAEVRPITIATIPSSRVNGEAADQPESDTLRNRKRQVSFAAEERIPEVEEEPSEVFNSKQTLDLDEEELTLKLPENITELNPNPGRTIPPPELRRSQTFPPPPQLLSDRQSLSDAGDSLSEGEEEEGKALYEEGYGEAEEEEEGRLGGNGQEEDSVSDESGYAEETAKEGAMEGGGANVVIDRDSSFIRV